MSPKQLDTVLIINCQLLIDNLELMRDRLSVVGAAHF